MPDDTCRSIVDFVPFIGLMNGATSPVVTRLMEAAIIAAVSTGIAMFAGVKVIEVELLNTKQKLGEIESSMDRKIDRLEVSIERQINEMDEKIKRVDGRVEKIYRDLYAPRINYNESNFYSLNTTDQLRMRINTRAEPNS